MNKELFLIINSLANVSHSLDLFFIFCAKYMPYIFILYEVWLYFFKKQKQIALFAFYAVIISLTINQIIALFYTHNRPFVDNIGVSLISHSIDSSFPSDHTTFLFAIAFSYLWFKLNRYYIWIILAFIGSIARVYVGVHYPFDIIGGIFVGFIASFVIFLLKGRLNFVNEIIFKIEKKLLKNYNN